MDGRGGFVGVEMSAEVPRRRKKSPLRWSAQMKRAVQITASPELLAQSRKEAGDLAKPGDSEQTREARVKTYTVFMNSGAGDEMAR